MAFARTALFTTESIFRTVAGPEDGITPSGVNMALLLASDCTYSALSPAWSSGGKCAAISAALWVLM